MKQRTFWTFLVGAFFIGLVPTTNAASLYIDPAMPTLHSGDSVTLSVRLDVDEEVHECVNAVSAVLTYPEGIEPVDVSIGESIFSMWVENPTIHPDSRTITFAGGIPNGYCGRVSGDPRLTNVLMRLVVMVPGFSIGGAGSSDIAKISFTDQSIAYLNDGQGTAVPVNGYPATISIIRKPGEKLQNDWQDEIAADDFPPEEFSITLERDTRAFSGKYYISFNTTDKQTGIDHYEVMEEPISQFGAFQWGRADAPWITTRSPYVLKDQTLNSIVRVKAVDKAGNEYIANLLPDETMRTMSYAKMITIAVAVGVLLLMIVMIVIVVVVLRRRKKRQATSETLDVEEEGIESSLEDNQDQTYE